MQILKQIVQSHREFESGDLWLFFDPANFSRLRADTDDSTSMRIGFRHEISPHSDFIVNLIRRERDSKLLFKEIAAIGRDDEGFNAEAQYLSVLDDPTALNIVDRLTVIGGAGHADVDRIALFEPILLGFSPDIKPETLRHTNTYVYSYAEFLNRLELTLGVSYDDFEDKNIRRHQVNPKLGLTFDLTSKIRLRAAAFRTLNRTILSDQTIEPTQVAGFNQFFDDPEGAKPWRYGVGADLHLFSGWYAGGEVTYRHLSIALPDVSADGTWLPKQHRETTCRAYVYGTVGKYFTFGAEYMEERFRHDIAYTQGDFKELHNRELRPTIGMPLPSGFSLQVRSRYVRQDGNFDDGIILNPDAAQFRGHDGFVLTDIELSYRLPRRYGKISLIGQSISNESVKFQDTLPSQASLAATPRLAYEQQFFLQVNLVSQ